MTLEEIVAALNALVEGADADGRDLTDDEVRKYEELEIQLASKRKTAELRARTEAYKTPVSGGLQVNTKTATAGEDTLERAFEHYLRTGKENQDIVELRAQAIATGGAGGYTVPDGFRQKIVERMKDFGGLQNVAENLTTASGNPMEWPTIDDTANSAEIVAEGAAAASAGADLVFGTKTLGAYKYESTGTGNVPLKVSWELLQDSAFDIQGLVARKLGERIARKFAVDLVNGSGTGQPQGLIAGGPTPIEIFANSSVPTYAELVTFVHNLDPAYRANASWLMSDATLAAFRKMVDLDGRPLWMPSAQASMAEMPGGTLLGHPVVIDQAMPSIADDTNCIAFGDFREGFVVRTVKDITLVTFNELYSVNGQVGYMAWMRGDSCVQNANAFLIGEGQID